MADISSITLPDETTYNFKDTEARNALNGHTVNSDVPANAVFTDTTYSALTASEISAAVTAGWNRT